MTAITVRVDADTYGKLVEVSQAKQISLDQVVAFLAGYYLDQRENARREREERERFRKQVYEDFRRLREDPAAWEEYKAEAGDWL